MWTLNAIKATHKGAGGHFFDTSALRFFDSRIESRIHEGKGGVFFVTSEQCHHGDGTSAPRKWTVRKWDLNSPLNISSPGGFQAFDTSARAHGYAAKKASRVFVDTGAPSSGGELRPLDCEGCGAAVFLSKVRQKWPDGTRATSYLCTKCCDAQKSEGVEVRNA